MVWLHGGAYLYGMGTGPSDGATTDGAALAEFGDVVVVTINHRLGIFGHLYLRDLFGQDFDGSGNVGLLDIAAALSWLRDNATVFGGDPDRALVFGQSGGASKAHTLMAMPRAAGLFATVALQSGYARSFHTPTSASAVAERLLEELGVHRPSDLAERTTAQLLEAQAQELRRDPTTVGLQPFYPVVDGTFLPVHPSRVDVNGWAGSVPMVVGTVRDEVQLFLDVDEDMDMETLVRVLAATTDDRAAHLATVYQSLYPDLRPADLWRAMETDRLFRQPAIGLAERRISSGSVWLYEFVYEAPADSDWPSGAPHAIEVPYIFQTANKLRARSLGVEHYPLSADIGAAWVSLARNGNPNHSRLPEWPQYDPDSRATMLFDSPCRVVSDQKREQRRAWGSAV